MPIPGPDPKILDDLARVAGGAVNIFSGLQDQIRNDIRARVEDMATRLDLVPRDELDRAVGMITKLRSQVQKLESRLDALEGNKKKPAAKTTTKTATKAPAKKAAPKAVKKAPAKKKK